MADKHKLKLSLYRTAALPDSVKTLDEWVGCGDIEDPWQCGVDKYFEVCQKLQTALKLLFKEII
jgi:protein-tyrosine-phosphatase